MDLILKKLREKQKKNKQELVKGVRDEYEHKVVSAVADAMVYLPTIEITRFLEEILDALSHEGGEK